MRTQRLILVALSAGVALLALGAGLATARDDPPPRDEQIADVAASSSNYIPVQGRLVDAGGAPLNGSYHLTYRLYDASVGGTALCTDDATLIIEQGLFVDYIHATDCSIDGRMLYLGIEVGTDGEMSPRIYINNVPYAWSLRPGAVISGTSSNGAIVHIENWGNLGRGLRAYAMATTSETYGVVGAARSPAGYGGFFYNNGGGTGLLASSNSGAALRAEGTGIIQSAAPSYVWISGNDVRPLNQGDSTIIDLNSSGAARVWRGTTATPKILVLPITIAGTLYGQEARLTALDIYWRGDTDLDAVMTIRLRRQTGVCQTCFEEILVDTTDYVCNEDSNATGCVIHNALTTNNVLSPSSGILYLSLELGYSGSTWIDLGGARLTVEYDD